MTLNRRRFLTTTLVAPLPFAMATPLWAWDHDIWSVQEIHTAMTADTARLVDIRRPDEWLETGIAEGAWPIDLTDPRFGERLFAARDLADGRPVALICRTGRRSDFVMDQVRQGQEMGFVDVAGGMLGSRAATGWIDSDLPVVSADVALSALPPLLM
jgi:rhodanese-related sulfurtransferase